MGNIWRSIGICLFLTLLTAGTGWTDESQIRKRESAVDWNIAVSSSVGAYFPIGDYYEGISWGRGFELGARIKLSSRACLGFAYGRPSFDVGEIIVQGPADQIVVLSPNQTSIETNRYTFFGEIHSLTVPESDLFFRSFYARFGFSVIDQELILKLTPQNQTDLEAPIDQLSGHEKDYGLDFGIGILIPFADIGYFDLNGTFRTVFFNKDIGDAPFGEEPLFTEKVGTATNLDFTAGLMIKF